MKINRKNECVSTREICNEINVENVVKETTSIDATIKKVVLAIEKGVNRETGELFDIRKYRIILDKSFVVLYQKNDVPIAREVNYITLHIDEIYDICDGFGIARFSKLYDILDELVKTKTIKYRTPEYFGFLEGAQISFDRVFHAIGDEIESFSGETRTVTFEHFETVINDFELSKDGVLELENAINDAQNLAYNR